MRLSEKSLDLLFRSHNKALNRFVRRRVGWEDGEDVAQEAYLRLLELEDVGKLADVQGYLFRIASNMAIDVLRKRRTRSAYLVEPVKGDELRESESAYATAMENAITVCKVQISLSQLPRCCGETFLLNRLYGLSYPEIAERLNISLRTVNRNMSRTIRHLHLAFGTCLDVGKAEPPRTRSGEELARIGANGSAPAAPSCKEGFAEQTPQQVDELVAHLQRLDNICVIASSTVDLVEPCFVAAEP